MEHRRGGHYLPESGPDPADFFWHLTVEDATGPYADPEQRGSVFVWTEPDDDHWSAWWVRGRSHAGRAGTRDDVIAWARAQPGGRVWVHGPDGYAALPPQP